ncbi:hypothetical protein [Cytobacillus kochii]|nr:hypothetical protein [Cytobacillus kochii]
MDLTTLVELAATNDDVDLKKLIVSLYGEKEAEKFYEQLKNC